MWLCFAFWCLRKVERRHGKNSSKFEMHSLFNRNNHRITQFPYHFESRGCSFSSVIESAHVQNVDILLRFSYDDFAQAVLFLKSNISLQSMFSAFSMPCFGDFYNLSNYFKMCSLLSDIFLSFWKHCSYRFEFHPTGLGESWTIFQRKIWFPSDITDWFHSKQF